MLRQYSWRRVMHHGWVLTALSITWRNSTLTKLWLSGGYRSSPLSVSGTGPFAISKSMKGAKSMVTFCVRSNIDEANLWRTPSINFGTEIHCLMAVALAATNGTQLSSRHFGRLSCISEPCMQQFHHTPQVFRAVLIRVLIVDRISEQSDTQF